MEPTGCLCVGTDTVATLRLELNKKEETWAKVSQEVGLYPCLLWLGH